MQMDSSQIGNQYNIEPDLSQLLQWVYKNGLSNYYPNILTITICILEMYYSMHSKIKYKSTITIITRQHHCPWQSQYQYHK